MARTVLDLSIRVLEKVGTGAAGGTPSTADSASLALLYAALYQEGEARGWAYWDEDSIPVRVFEAMADLMAGRWAADQGYPPLAGAANAEARLMRMGAQAPTGEIVTGEFF